MKSIKKFGLSLSPNLFGEEIGWTTSFLYFRERKGNMVD
jgi:hypothetical protein